MPSARYEYIGPRSPRFYILTCLSGPQQTRSLVTAAWEYNSAAGELSYRETGRGGGDHWDER